MVSIEDDSPLKSGVSASTAVPGSKSLMSFTVSAKCLALRAGGCPNPIGDANSCRVLPAHDGSTGGRANLAGRIAIGEAHPRLGKSIDVGSLVKGRALDGEVFDAKIIGENEHDVGFSQRDEGNEEEERKEFHLIGGGKRKIETKTIHFGVSTFWGFRQTAGVATDL